MQGGVEEGPGVGLYNTCGRIIRTLRYRDHTVAYTSNYVASEKTQSQISLMVIWPHL